MNKEMKNLEIKNVEVKDKFCVNPKWYLILETVRELNDRTYSLKVNRTIYQKICYVLTRNGINTGFIFTKEDCRLYSKQVEESLTILKNIGLITEQNLDKMVYLSVSDNVVIHKEIFSSKEWKAMEQTVDLFGRIKGVGQAEIVATVLYTYDELRTHKGTITDKDIYDYIMDWKLHWKTEKEFEVCDAIHNLAMLSLISIEHTGSIMDTLEI